MTSNTPLYLQIMDDVEKRIKARVERLEQERKEKEKTGEV
jgi:hypothetical protein